MWARLGRFAELFGEIAAWLFFAIGLFVAWEVMMRYLFNAPTIWVDEVSRILQIWATLLAGAYLVKYRELIVIDVFMRRPDTLARKLSESVAILMIATFCAVVAWHGFALWLKATLAGHTTDSFLAVPKWITHAALWVGCGLMLAQSVIELVRVWRTGVPDHGPHEEI